MGYIFKCCSSEGIKISLTFSFIETKEPVLHSNERLPTGSPEPYGL